MLGFDWALNSVSRVGGGILFLSEAFDTLRRRGLKKGAVLEQMFAIGVHSLPITIVAGMFVGAVLAIQIDLQLRDFGAESFLGGLSTSTTLRNLGPVLIAFLLAGKVGAFTSAELGTMQVTDQLNAIRCLGADPIETIVVPRLVAVAASSFLLLGVGLMTSVVGGLTIANLSLGVNPLSFISQIPRFVSVSSLVIAATKSLVFGLLIGGTACYFGYTARGGAVGVGKSVRDSAVMTMISIVVMDCAISVGAAFFLDMIGG